jgi:hypothetical protein
MERSVSQSRSRSESGLYAQQSSQKKAQVQQNNYMHRTVDRDERELGTGGVAMSYSPPSKLPKRAGSARFQRQPFSHHMDNENRPRAGSRAPLPRRPRKVVS